MVLVLDTNIFISEVMKIRGLKLLKHPELSIYVTERQLNEIEHELLKRLEKRAEQIDPAVILEVLQEAIDILTTSVTVVPEAFYARFLPEAKLRMLDTDDLPSVALALLLCCGVWTRDRDFFGTGISVWSSDVLVRKFGI
jgi:predicted nucleic acid-binding protein